MTAREIQQEALYRARISNALSNYPAIIHGFAEKGISETEIEPRVNVFTYHAWKALGRSVKKGEHGVKVNTWIPIREKVENTDTGEKKDKVVVRRPRITTVFHVSQTEKVVDK